ncbi:PREDICTED: predicted GPI-anchored protein 58 [Tarenaya hassleriana]|uniref:predicted GPI-anchored protein 58 n=1 Tax=Tarenaya hassleriana TaxID=28532 RepID=UPI00053C8E9A|nr:PREDICTED: predicted GPI-anchored protein 58 [Tarenaya hassleriana]
MDTNKNLGAIVVIAVSALFALFTSVDSECVPLLNSYVARSLLPVFLPSNTEAPSPAPSQDTLSPSPEIPAPKAAAPTMPSSRKVSPGVVPAVTTSPANPPSLSEPMAPSPNEPLISSGEGLGLIPQLLPPEIKTVCAETDFPALCESSIQPLLTGQTKPDPESVLLLMIRASHDATKSALDVVRKLAEEGGAASDCEELYDLAVRNFDDAVEAAKSRDSGTLNINLSAAMTDFVTCSDGFEEMGEPNPLADVGDKLMKMASNCLAISTSSLIKF